MRMFVGWHGRRADRLAAAAGRACGSTAGCIAGRPHPGLPTAWRRRQVRRAAIDPWPFWERPRAWCSCCATPPAPCQMASRVGGRASAISRLRQRMEAARQGMLKAANSRVHPQRRTFPRSPCCLLASAHAPPPPAQAGSRPCLLLLPHLRTPRRRRRAGAAAARRRARRRPPERREGGVRLAQGICFRSPAAASPLHRARRQVQVGLPGE